MRGWRSHSFCRHAGLNYSLFRKLQSGRRSSGVGRKWWRREDTASDSLRLSPVVALIKTQYRCMQTELFSLCNQINSSSSSSIRGGAVWPDGGREAQPQLRGRRATVGWNRNKVLDIKNQHYLLNIQTRQQRNKIWIINFFLDIRLKYVLTLMLTFKHTTQKVSPSVCNLGSTVIGAGSLF